MSLPDVDVVRERIESVTEDEMRLCLMCGYLFCGRVSELVAKASPKDTTVARGPLGTNVRYDTFELGAIKSEVAVFKVSTAKRGGIERRVGLPLEKEYEPWTQELFEYFRQRGKQPVFPFTRQKAWAASKQAFEGLRYPIETYRLFKNGKLIKVVDRHLRSFRTHALRHIRATELIEFYGFDGIDLSIYGGWTLQSAIGVGASLQRYAHLQWRKYYPKLLKKR